MSVRWSVLSETVTWHTKEKKLKRWLVRQFLSPSPHALPARETIEAVTVTASGSTSSSSRATRSDSPHCWDRAKNPMSDECGVPVDALVGVPQTSRRSGCQHGCYSGGATRIDTVRGRRGTVTCEYGSCIGGYRLQTSGRGRGCTGHRVCGRNAWLNQPRSHRLESAI